MKNLLFILTLFISANSFAQTFDETVNYINKFFDEYEHLDINWLPQGSKSSDLVHGIIVEKNGKITFFKHFDENTYNKNTKSPTGFFNVFDFEKFNKDGRLYLLDTNNRVIGSFSGFPTTHISKIEKAFKHLKTLCTKEKDPFE